MVFPRPLLDRCRAHSRDGIERMGDIAVPD